VVDTLSYKISIGLWPISCHVLIKRNTRLNAELLIYITNV